MNNHEKRSTSVNGRAANVAHVISTSGISGHQPSPLLKSLFARYEAGEITSAELVCAVLEKYPKTKS